MSCGTLFPMLERLEESQLVLKVERDHVSYNWFLTSIGIKELDSRLALMARVLQSFTKRPDDGSSTNVGIESQSG